MQVQYLGQESPLEEGMATHSSILAWKIPWTEEPGGLQSIGSQRVGHDWSDLAVMHDHSHPFGSFCLLLSPEIWFYRSLLNLFYPLWLISFSTHYDWVLMLSSELLFSQHFSLSLSLFLAWSSALLNCPVRVYSAAWKHIQVSHPRKCPLDSKLATGWGWSAFNKFLWRLVHLYLPFSSLCCHNFRSYPLKYKIILIKWLINPETKCSKYYKTWLECSFPFIFYLIGYLVYVKVFNFTAVYCTSHSLFFFYLELSFSDSFSNYFSLLTCRALMPLFQFQHTPIFISDIPLKDLTLLLNGFLL